MSIVDAIEAEVKAGLGNEAARLEDAAANYDFYRGDFSAHDPRAAVGDYQPGPHPRTASVMRRIVQVLGQHLYAKGPARVIPDKVEASTWLSETYAMEGADALLQECDRLSFVADVAAVEAYETQDPDRPVGLRLWPAHQLLIWEDPDETCRPLAVGVLDYFDARRRLRVWTADELRTYTTNRLAPGQTAGGTAFYREGDPYAHGYGCIPFAFFHCNLPTVGFYAGSPGTNLRVMNEYINGRLTDVGDNLGFAGKPVTVIHGVGSAWRPPKPIRPGDIWFPTYGQDAVGNGVAPSVDSFTHDLGFVESSWSDMSAFLDLTLEVNGVPKSAVRMIQTGAASGIAIVAEQLPLISFAEARQRPFGTYEKRLAHVTLAVGRVATDNPALDPALARYLALRWPSMVPEVPKSGPEQDQADAFALERGWISRVQVVMRRFNLDRTAALEHLAQVAKDDADERALVPITPTPAADPARGGPPSPSPDETDDDGEIQE